MLAGRRPVRWSGLALALVVAAVWAAQSAHAATSPATSYRLDPGRTGALADPDPRPPLRRLWETAVRRPSYPVIADGRVHVADRNPTGPTLRTFDLATGALLWSRALAPAGGTQAWRPLWHAGRVIVHGDGGELAAYDADTGAPLWAVDLEQFLTGLHAAPLAAGNVVFASGEHTHAVDLATGGVLWSSSGGRTPALADRALYFSLSCERALAISAQDGQRLWGGYGCGWGAKDAAVRDGRVYVRSRDQGHVLRAGDGATLRSFTATAAPAIGGGLVVTVNRRTLAAHDEATGALRWTATVSGDDIYTLLSAPILVGTTVYTAAPDGRLFAFSAATGALLEQRSVGAPVAADDVDGSNGGLAAGEGALVVPALDRLVGFGSTAGVPPASRPTGDPPAASGAAGQPPHRDAAPSPPASRRPRSSAATVRAVTGTVIRALRRRGRRTLLLTVAPTERGRLLVQIRARDRRFARATGMTSPARAIRLRLRLPRFARRVVVVVRHGDEARRRTIRLRK